LLLICRHIDLLVEIGEGIALAQLVDESLVPGCLFTPDPVVEMEDGQGDREFLPQACEDIQEDYGIDPA
jgi:hypothetical protein